MLALEAQQLLSGRLLLGEGDEAQGRAELEHRPHLAEFFGEVLGEALEHPRAILTAFQKTILLETVEIFPHGRGRYAGRKLERIDLLPGPAVSIQDLLHEPLFNQCANLLLSVSGKKSAATGWRRTVLRRPSRAIRPAAERAARLERMVVRLTSSASAHEGSEPMSDATAKDCSRKRPRL